MNKAPAQKHRRPVATVQRIRRQTRPASRVTVGAASGTAPLPARVSRGNTSGGGDVVK